MDKEPEFSPEQFLAWLFQDSDHFEEGIPLSEASNAADAVTADLRYDFHNGFKARGERMTKQNFSDQNSSEIDCAQDRFASERSIQEPSVQETAAAANYNWVELESLILNSFDSEAIDQVAGSLQGFSPLSGQTTFKLGEQFKVQDRFYRLIKHRLETEIQQRPPLFPWETELSDYETEAVYAAEVAVPTPSIEESISLIWAAQLRRLNLPISMPLNLLSQLLRQCQSAMQSPLREGAKLVQAVESLFPEDIPLLNELAARVLVSPARGPAATWQGLPETYQAANSKQQMVLSLLAAKEILRSLSLTVSQAQPTLEREWLTEVGALTLRVDYESQSSQVRVAIQLPCGGSLKLQTMGSQSMTFRADAGYLSATVFGVPGHSTTLEVRLEDAGQEPLIFTIDAI